MQNLKLMKLCLVTNIKNTCLENYKEFLFQVINGGISSIQLREKNLKKAEFKELASQIKSFLDRFNTPLIINDHVEIAKKIDAAGVHIGQSDMSPRQAREILGVEKIIGWSVDTWQQLEIANGLDCINYIGATVFSTSSKLDCQTYWGLDGLQKLALASKHPVVAIGGVDLGNVKQLMQAGAYGVAVVSALHNAKNPEKIAESLKAKIENYAR